MKMKIRDIYFCDNNKDYLKILRKARKGDLIYFIEK